MLADHTVSAEHPTREERPVRDVRTLAVSQATLRDAIVGIPGLNEDAVTDFVTTEGHNKVIRMESRLQARLKGLVNKTLGEKLNSV